jgi:DNA (cytosine-5)-methyltransferase 1
MSQPYRLLDLFSGIGGFSLGLERSGGFKTVAFCEIEPFPRRVLKKHWPDVPIYEDVRTLTAERLAADGISVDAICGGFPCQDLSVAGKRAGIDGERSGLWSEYARLIGEVRPRVVIVENVAGLLSGPSEQPGQWFGRVLGDLASLGYDAEWRVISASDVGAPHRRERVWLVAYPDRERALQSKGLVSYQRRRAGNGSQALPHANDERTRWGEQFSRGCESAGDVADSGSLNAQRIEPECAYQEKRSLALWGQIGSCRDGSGWWGAEPDVGRVAHGIPARVDRLKGLGNAVVPQIPELIGRAIIEAEALS